MPNTKILKDIDYHANKYWYCKERLDVIQKQKSLLLEKKSRNKKERKALNKKLCELLYTSRSSKPVQVTKNKKDKTQNENNNRPKKRQRVSNKECNIEKKMYNGPTNRRVTDQEMIELGFENYIKFMSFRHDNNSINKNPFPGCKFLTHPFDRTSKSSIQRCWECKMICPGEEKIGRNAKFGFWRNNYDPSQYYYICRQCFNSRNKKRLLRGGGIETLESLKTMLLMNPNNLQEGDDVVLISQAGRIQNHARINTFTYRIRNNIYNYKDFSESFGEWNNVPPDFIRKDSGEIFLQQGPSAFRDNGIQGQRTKAHLVLPVVEYTNSKKSKGSHDAKMVFKVNDLYKISQSGRKRTNEKYRVGTDYKHKIKQTNRKIAKKQKEIDSMILLKKNILKIEGWTLNIENLLVKYLHNPSDASITEQLRDVRDALKELQRDVCNEYKTMKKNEIFKKRKKYSCLPGSEEFKIYDTTQQDLKKHVTQKQNKKATKRAEKIAKREKEQSMIKNYKDNLISMLKQLVPFLNDHCIGYAKIKAGRSSLQDFFQNVNIEYTIDNGIQITNYSSHTRNEEMFKVLEPIAKNFLKDMQVRRKSLEKLFEYYKCEKNASTLKQYISLIETLQDRLQQLLNIEEEPTVSLSLFIGDINISTMFLHAMESCNIDHEHLDFSEFTVECIIRCSNFIRNIMEKFKNASYNFLKTRGYNHVLDFIAKIRNDRSKFLEVYDSVNQQQRNILQKLYLRLFHSSIFYTHSQEERNHDFNQYLLDIRNSIAHDDYLEKDGNQEYEYYDTLRDNTPSLETIQQQNVNNRNDISSDSDDENNGGW